MTIHVTAKTGAKQNSIEEVNHNSFKVTVTARPVDNMANEAIIELLAKHFDVAKSLVTLKLGATSKLKTFEIEK